jgi:hypothetical protein
MAQAIEPLPAPTSALVVAEVLAPLIARGLIIRRPGVLSALARVDADRRAVERLRQVRAAHGPDLALLRLPRRPYAVVLSDTDARVVLDGTPEPFTPANLEKRAALSRFEPHSVLISPPEQRPPRRRFNEQALDTRQPMHHLGAALSIRIGQESRALLASAQSPAELDWPGFEAAFHRISRAIVLGDAAAEDQVLTDQLRALRRTANWSYLAPPRPALRDNLQERLRAYLSSPQPGSLAQHVSTLGATPEAVQEAVDQLPQWLFGFDAAAIAAFTTLALLSTHPRQLRTAREESEQRATADQPIEMPFLRACVLETLRLWPATPAILRDATADTEWPAGTLPAGSGVLIYAPLFHRDEQLEPGADTFAPERWLTPGQERLRDDGSEPFTTLFPFSRGAARCPGRELVLFVTSELIGQLLRSTGIELKRPHAELLGSGRALPGTLSHFQLRFELRPHKTMRPRPTKGEPHASAQLARRP